MPGGNTVQIALGEAIIASIVSFARNDVKAVPEIVRVLSHVSDPVMKQTIAEGIYGARWIYKLGLVLLTENDEMVAHARAQIVEYAAAAEAILYNMITQSDPTYQTTTFRKYINKARNVRIVSLSMQGKLHELRRMRNEVHIPIRNRYRFIESSRRAWRILKELVVETRRWKGLPPEWL